MQAAIAALDTDRDARAAVIAAYAAMERTWAHVHAGTQPRLHLGDAEALDLEP